MLYLPLPEQLVMGWGGGVSVNISIETKSLLQMQKLRAVKGCCSSRLPRLSVEE